MTCHCNLEYIISQHAAVCTHTYACGMLHANTAFIFNATLVNATFIFNITQVCELLMDAIL